VAKKKKPAGPQFTFRPSNSFPWAQVDEARAVLKATHANVRKLRQYGIVTSAWLHNTLDMLAEADQGLVALAQAEAEKTGRRTR